jgi:arylsulfatase A-like enzyme
MAGQGFLLIASLSGIAMSRVLAAEPHSEHRPPNFVIILADDQGYGDVGCYGARGFQTPNLDRMAAEGIRFTDFYVAQPICSASRAALLTGCYPNRIGILDALGPSAKHGIHATEQTIAEVLKSRDYATAIYGKWHLGHQPAFLPTRHGFDDYFGLPYSNDMWPKHPTAKLALPALSASTVGLLESPLGEGHLLATSALIPGRGTNYPDLPLMAGERIIAYNPDQTQLTTWYTEHAVNFIAKNKDRSFFLYVAHAMPHVPLHVSDKFRGKSAQGLYGDVIMEVDWSVGQILAALKQHGLDEQTLVIYTSDNGPWLSYGSHAGSAGPLREGKATIWEGGVREPCIMRWPGKIPPASVCREPAMTIDILPTLARLAGAPLPEHQIDGLDIWPLISAQPGAQSPHETLYFYWGRQLQAVRSGKWKLHFAHDYRSLDGKPGGNGSKPALYAQKKTGLALYDLEKDIGETMNVADQHPEVVAQLQRLAEKARADFGDSATKQKGKGVRPAGSLGPS